MHNLTNMQAVRLLGFALLVVLFCTGLAVSGALAASPAPPAPPAFPKSASSNQQSLQTLQAAQQAAVVPQATCTPGTTYVYTSTTGASIVPGVTNLNNPCDDCPTTFTLPFTYNFYGVAYNQATANSNGTLQFTSSLVNFANECLPTSQLDHTIFAYWDDLLTNPQLNCSVFPSGCGIFTSVSGSAPNRIVNVEWRATIFSDDSPVNFEVRLYEGQSRFDIIYGTTSQGGSSATVGVQRDRYSPPTLYECNTPGSIVSGRQISFSLPPCGAAGTPTPTATPASCGENANFTVAQATGTIVPGDTLVPGAQGDEALVTIPLPFNFRFYGQVFPSVNASTNGNLQFSGANVDFFNVCLPSARMNNLIAAYWDDLIAIPPEGGIFTSVSGSAPNRIFNIEWRACQFDDGCGVGTTNFEVRLYENGGQGERFDIVYGQIVNGNSATIGVQKQYGSNFTLFSCNTVSITQGLVLQFSLPLCAAPTPTPTCPPAAIIPQTIGLNNPGEPNVVMRPQTMDDGRWTMDDGKTVFNLQSSILNTHPHQAQDSSSIVHRPSSPISFMLDDGTRETSLSFGESLVTETAAIWLNRFTPGNFNYPLTINQISVLWPTQAVMTDTLVGKSAKLLVYLDADGDNDPSNATLIGQQNVTIGALETFEDYTVNVPVSGPGDIYIGFEDLWAASAAGYSPRLYPASQDTNNPQVRSWIAAMSAGGPPNINILGQNDLLGTVDSFGLPGDLMIRASADTQGAPCASPTPTITPGGPTLTPSNTPTRTRTSLPTITPAISNTPGPTNTITRTPTNTPTSPPTNTPTRTSTNTPTSAATNTPTSTSTLTRTPTPPSGSGNLVGHVIWQTIPQNNTRSVLPITLTLKLGTTEVNYPVQNTDLNGFFTVSVGSLPNGTYNWRVQSPDGPSGGNTTAGFLSNCGTVVLAGTPQTNMENSQIFPTTGCTAAPGCIRGGDGTNDNIISIGDFNLLKTQFNSTGIRQSDYNNTLIVDISDFNILKGNFNSPGCTALAVP